MTAVVADASAIQTPSDVRVGIFQPCVPRYRVPLFDRLARHVQHLTVFAGPLDNAAGFGDAGGHWRFERRIVAHRPAGPFIWMPSMWREAKAGEFDVLIFTWNSRYLALLPGLRRAARQGIATVLWGHGYSKRETGWRRRLRNAIGHSADALLLYGRDAAERLIEEGFEREHVHIATNAIDQDEISAARERWLAQPAALHEFQSRHEIAGRPVALYVSRLTAGRGIACLFDAWKKVAARLPEARLVVVGDGPARGQWQEYCRAMGIGDSVRFVGAVYGEDAIAPWFLSARVLSYPVRIGLTLHHAFGYGCPVVTYDTPDLHGPEYAALRDGVNGFAIKPDDVEALAERTAGLLGDPLRAREMGAAARQTILNEFTLEHTVSGFLRAIHDARTRRRAARGSPSNGSGAR